jgi:hypothetical protein
MEGVAETMTKAGLSMGCQCFVASIDWPGLSLAVKIMQERGGGL